MKLSKIWPLKHLLEKAPPLELKWNFSVDGKTLLDVMKIAAAQIGYAFELQDGKEGRQVLVRKQAPLLWEQTLVTSINTEAIYTGLTLLVQNFYLTVGRAEQYRQAIADFARTVYELLDAQQSFSRSAIG